MVQIKSVGDLKKLVFYFPFVNDKLYFGSRVSSLIYGYLNTKLMCIQPGHLFAQYLRYEGRDSLYTHLKSKGYVVKGPMSGAWNEHFQLTLNLTEHGSSKKYIILSIHDSHMVLFNCRKFWICDQTCIRIYGFLAQVPTNRTEFERFMYYRQWEI